MSQPLWSPPSPDHVPAELMVDFDFFHVPKGVTDPMEIWRDLQRRGVPHIFYTPRNGGHWVFLDYKDVVTAYRDYERFSTYQTPIPPIEPYPTMQPQGIDPPQHKVFRSLLAPLFTPTAIREMTEELHRRAKKLIDVFKDAGGCDFMRDYATLLPTSAFLHLMGLSEERLPEFKKLADVFFREPDEALRKQNIDDINAVLHALFEERRKNPGNDLASVILSARDEDGRPAPYEDIMSCGFLLFVAGLDTVTNTMAYIWRYLAITPEAQEYFRSNMGNRDRLMFGLEELLRINAVSNLFRRCKTDFTYKGITFRTNDRVVLPNNLANRDPTIFERPDDIILDRQVNNHVTFGVGPHRCVGSHLAKAEILVSLMEWFAVIPEFRLGADLSDVRAFGGAVMGFASLPIQWNAER